jgi:hypothetical protein
MSVSSKKDFSLSFTHYIREFGIDIVLGNYFRYIGKYKTISVGSGNGVFEKLLEMDGIHVTCVDPLLMKNWLHSESSGLKPKYDYVKNAIEKEPHLIGQNLILISPLPEKKGRTSYDIEAIKVIKPNKIFMLIDIEGSSGSKHVIDSVINRKNNIVTFGNDKYKIINEVKKDFDKKIFLTNEQQILLNTHEKIILYPTKIRLLSLEII